jgi:hypothetical protein
MLDEFARHRLLKQQEETNRMENVHFFTETGKVIWISPSQRNTINTRMSRVCCNAAVSLWENISSELFEEKPELYSKLLEIRDAAESTTTGSILDDPSYQAIKDDLKDTDFFRNFDVAAFANQIKNTMSSENSGKARLLTTLVEDDEEILMQRLMWTVDKMERAKTTNKKTYEGMTKEPVKKRKQQDLAEEEEEVPMKPSSYTSRKRKAEEEESEVVKMPVVTSEELDELQARKKQSFEEEQQQSTLEELQARKQQFYEEKQQSDIEVDDYFSLIMYELENCCSNTINDLGVEIVIYRNWLSKFTGKKRPGILSEIADLIQQACSDEEDGPGLENFKEGIAKILPLMMIVQVPQSNLLVQHTPAMGQCFYMLHLQLFLRARGNYQVPMDSLETFLPKEGASDEEFLEILKVEYDKLDSFSEEDRWTMGTHDLYELIPNVLKFCGNPANKGKFMSDAWGPTSSSCRLFFAPEYIYHMTMFLTMEAFAKECLNFNFPYREKYTALTDAIVYYQSTSANVYTEPGFAPYNVIKESLLERNAGCYSNSHFYPVFLENNFVEHMQKAYEAFCSVFYKIIRTFKRELINMNFLEKIKAHQDAKLRRTEDPTKQIDKIDLTNSSPCVATKSLINSSPLVATTQQPPLAIMVVLKKGEEAWNALIAWKNRKQERKEEGVSTQELADVLLWINQLENGIYNKM